MELSMAVEAIKSGDEWPPVAEQLSYGTYQNTSGIIPLDKRIIVLPDPVPEKTSGGLILPETAQEREKYATMKATLVAIGELAWGEAMVDAANWKMPFKRPKPGDRVLIAKYGGILLTGDDGNDYRIMNDADVNGLLEG